MANIFVEIFARVFSSSDPPAAYARYKELCHNNIDPLIITPEKVDNILNGLDMVSTQNYQSHYHLNKLFLCG